MAQPISVQGLIATTPRFIKTTEDIATLSFRLASSERRYDTIKNRWIDGETNWYTIIATRGLAENAYKSINKGDRIMVSGNLRIRDWDNGERAGTAIEIEAEAIGHDMTWGESTFNRTVLVKPPTPSDFINAELNDELTKTKDELKELRELLGELSEGRA